MMNEEPESENVQAGSSHVWLPSDICTDRTIFNHIFSLDTWNTVLRPDQKDRIMKMLPAEVLSTPGAAVSTIEDLISGTLQRFNRTPLDIFFTELNNGGYDPGVREFQAKMNRIWRRDLQERMQHYHTKFMQDVIVSSQACLQKLSDKTSSKAQKTPKAKSCKNSKIQKQESPKPPQTTAKKKPSTSKPSPLRQKVAKRLHNEIQAMSQAFPPVASVVTSQADEPPAQKKSRRKPKKGISPKPTPINETANNLKTETDQPQHNFGLSQLRTGIQPISVAPPQTSIQMAKFPSVIPPSLIGVINVTQSPSSGLCHPPKHQVISNHFENKTPLIQEAQTTVTSSTTPLISQQVMQRHVLKASPILASQLQAPIVTAVDKSSSSTVSSVRPITHNTNNLAKELPHALKMEEETSSGDDEFEAIEPTIGFFSTMLPTSNKPPHQKVVNTKGSTYTTPRNHQTNNKITTSKKRTLSKVNSQTNPPKSNAESFHVNVKVTNSKAIITATPTLVTPQSNKFLRSPAESGGKLAPTSNTFVQSSTHSLSSTTTASTVSSQLGPSKVMFATAQNHLGTTNKLNPITLSTLAQHHHQLNHQQNSKVRSFRNGSSSSIGGLSNLNTTPAVIATQPGTVTVNGTPTFMHQGARTGGTHFTVATADTASTSFGGLAMSAVGRGVNKPRALSLSPLPMTLSDLSLSLNLGLDVSGDKLEDKIDLPVLDGNAFDSIPNLGDDLDVFDLDLVDGLCDFEVMLSEEKQYSSFFALIREVLCSTQNHRMTYSCLEKTVQKWALSGSAGLNPWFHRITGWSEALITALNFLAGNYQEIHPEDFVPYLEYKYKTKYYQWIGAGRDSDGNLLTLCHMWLDNLDKLPPVKKQDGENEEQEEEEDENEDSDEHTEEVKKYLRPKTPPPPRFVTDWTVRPSTTEEKDEFQCQEKVRFDNPHKAFTYRMHKYESVVGPVKGVYSNQTGVTNKARGHSLLVDDRPPYVTILALVRDSVARLPNGEGTRSEICEMLRDSAFLAPEASNVTLNSVVSGALDRLHYERDPCVRYDSHKKNWIYLHRDRSQEQFERLHHNRSYTKSTKSRNNGGRKSRKKTLSQNSTSATESVSSASGAQSGTSSVSSTPVTPSNVTAPQALPSLVTLTDSNVPASISQSTLSAVPSSSGSPLLSPSIAKPTTAVGNNVFVSAKTVISPAMQFAIPVSTNQTVLNAATHTHQSLPSLSDGVTNSAPTSSVGVTPSGVAAIRQSHYVPATNSSQTQIPLSIKLENPLTVSSSTTTPNCVTTASAQQQGFIFNNIFRLPNLKLPDNVRFLRIQPAPAGVGQQVQLNPLRLPQQRIVLRPAFPGYGPGQGMIVGHTPSGQTVIISAIGGPQVLSTQTQSFATQPTQSTESTTSATFPSAAILKLPTADNATRPTFVASTPVATMSNSSSITPRENSPVPVAVAQQSEDMSASPQLKLSTPPVSSVFRLPPGSATGPTNRSVLSSTTLPNTNNKLPMEMAEVAQFQRRNPVGGLTVTTSAPSTVLNTRLPNAPVVIRSKQVEYHNPSTQRLASGRSAGALQGIKMIPVVSSSNQVFARLLSPAPAPPAKPAIQTSATTNTQALL